MGAPESPDRPVTINAYARDARHIAYTSPQTDRWAALEWRDAVGCARPTSFHLALSDGREVGGEMSAYCAVRIACQWVREGR